MTPKSTLTAQVWNTAKTNKQQRLGSKAAVCLPQLWCQQGKMTRADPPRYQAIPRVAALLPEENERSRIQRKPDMGMGSFPFKGHLTKETSIKYVYL